MYIKRFYCPTCGSLTTTNGSRALHPLLRRSYAQCSNHLCSASWQLSIEVTASVSPTSPLYAADSPVLPGIADADDIAYEVALQFIDRDESDIDSILVQCPLYLQQRLGLDAGAADVLTRQVLVKQNKERYISWLGLDIAMGNDVSVSAPVLLDEGWDG